jgi:membrane-associated phospholipid phosphatase
MLHQAWKIITDLGDAAVVLPLALLLLAALWRYESRRAAWVFLRALIGCGIGLALLKVLFISCGRAWHAAQLESPSGHTGLSIFVYGALAAVAMNAAQGGAVPRALPPADGLAAAGPAQAGGAAGGWLATFIAYTAPPLVAAIAVSRVALGSHTLPEVAVGALVGLAALAGFALPYRRLPRARFPMTGFVILMLVVYVLTYGDNSPAEDVIRYLAAMFSRSTGVCRG